MGFLDRFFNNDVPVVKNVIIVNVLFWLATLKFPFLDNYLGMHYWASSKFNPVQLVTYLFMHADFNHLFFNMFAVFMFGVVIERVWGSKRFLLYYLITGIGAAIVQQVVWTIEYQPLISALTSGNVEELLASEGTLRRLFSYHSIEYLSPLDMNKMANTIANFPVTIGASGAVFGILLAFGWLFPDVKLMMIFLPIPIKARVFVALYAIAELFLGVAKLSNDNVAHFAHLGGMIFGALLILYWKKKGNLFYH
ncbi:MAG: rhomboid family intramembrane serine protease [Paludibacteraceae bacterium]|nr:rhomboid family intramembrane serine protease [Paludibacteraceae bacterium]